MKYLIIFNLVALLAGGALAEEAYLKDVPEGHWATSAVYELVRMGVTKGYPDGTFRGKKEISRYEIAAFLAKFAGYYNLRRGKNEKLVEELRTETALLKYQRDKAAKATQFSGSLQSRAAAASMIPRGGVFDYRLKARLIRDLGYGSSLKINLDTMDAGYSNNVPRSLTTEMLDLEGRVKLAGLKVKFRVGPGPVLHRDPTGIIPSEDRMVFLRPYTGIEAFGRIKKLDVYAAYQARQIESSGEVTVHELTKRLSYRLKKNLKLTVQPRYLFEINGQSDLRGEVAVDYKFNSKAKTRLLLGVGSVQEGTSGLHLRLSQDLLDLFGTGLNLSLRGDKVGSKYRSAFVKDVIYILNNYDRQILDGTVDLGWSFSRRLNKQWSVEEKGNLSMTGSYKYGAAYPGTHLIEQLSVKYNYLANIVLRAFYRFYKVPSEVNQYGEAVPTKTDLLGVGVKYSF